MYLPPQDEKAEKSVIGSILIARGGNALSMAQRTINPGMFYSDACKAVYHAMTKARDGNGVDLITVQDTLKQSGDLDRVGGQGFLTSCLDEVGHADHIEHYCRIVARLFYERKIGDRCFQFKSEPTAEGMDDINHLFQKREELSRPCVESITETLHRAVDKLDGKKKPDRFTIGFKNIDTTVNFMNGGEINVWAAAPNVGKSVTMANLALHSSLTEKTLYFGTEMSSDEQANRMIPMLGGPAAWQIRKGLIGEQMGKYMEAANTLSLRQLQIIDNPEPSLNDVERAIDATGARIIFLDYLEQFSMPKAENYRLKITEFMKRLKVLSRKKNVLVNLASQLNRTAYGKDEGKTAPNNSQLSESSSIEKVADRIFLIWVPDSLNQTEQSGVVFEVINSKNRHGRKGAKWNLFLNHQSLKMTEYGSEL